MRKCLLLLVAFAMVWCGCATSPPRRLSKEEVIRLAQRVGQEHGEHLWANRAAEPFFDAHSRTWDVEFCPKDPYHDEYPWAKGFAVEINDATGSTTYHGGIYR